MNEPAPHHHYFQMIEGGMACACGEIIKAEPTDMASMLKAFDLAMDLEGVTASTRDRVMSRLLYGTPYPAGRQVRERPQAIPVSGLTITEQAAALFDPYQAASIEIRRRAMTASQSGRYRV